MLLSMSLVLVVGLASAVAKPVAQTQEGKEFLAVKLRYGTFEATSERRGIVTWKDIPYAAPPVDELRWAKPEPPVDIEEVQYKDRRGGSCYQAVDRDFYRQSDFRGPVGVTRLFFNPKEYIINTAECGSKHCATRAFQQSEDCLFLDVQVPKKVLKNPSQLLPVVVYIYGGAFMTGDKGCSQPHTPLYNGEAMIDASNHNIIWVTFNYRLGALGFLAGSTMEAEGVPNAGLWDQRAAFQWVQDHIHEFGGDKNSVTAMGEDAGAASIMHHLVAEGGTLDPLFHRAILMSPSFQARWDRKGAMEDVYQSFIDLLPRCKDKGLACLRKLDEEQLEVANYQLQYDQFRGTFGVGPSPDGSYIRQDPILELATGNFWPIESLIVTHTSDEGKYFAKNSNIYNDDIFRRFLGAITPGYLAKPGITHRVVDKYRATVAGHDMKGAVETMKNRSNIFFRDSVVNCNVRHLAEAMGPTKVWLMRYALGKGVHGQDLRAAFNYPKLSFKSYKKFVLSLAQFLEHLNMSGMDKEYQLLFSRYIMFGDPNQVWSEERGFGNKHPHPSRFWAHPDLSGDSVKDVLKFQQKSRLWAWIGDRIFGMKKPNPNIFLMEDDQIGFETCQFWKNFSAAATVAGGYVPDEVVLEQDWVVPKKD